MKTQAAILIEQNKALEIDEVEIPKLGIGQVLVDISVSRICGSQIGEIDGVKGPDRWLPHLLGHEGGGTVLEVGPGVKTVVPGDRVVLHWRPSDGLEADCPKFGWNGKTANAGHIATFNHLGVITENRMTAVPKDTDFELCSLMADTLTTGFGVISHDARVNIGESVVLIGAGGIGSGTILGAQLAGANPIVAVDLYDHKLELARKLGATHVFNGRSEDLEDQIRDAVGSDGADVVIDGTGIPSVIEQCYSLTKQTGRCVLFGVMHHEKRVNLHTLPLHFGRVLTGSEGGQSLPHIEIPRYLRLIRDRGIDLSPLVTHRGPLTDVNSLISGMRSGEVQHAMLHYDNLLAGKLGT